MATKSQLEKELREMTQKYEKLVTSVEELTLRAVADLSICNDGIEIISELRESAGLKAETTKKVKLTLEMELDYATVSRLEDNIIGIEDLDLSIDGEYSDIDNYDIDILN